MKAYGIIPGQISKLWVPNADTSNGALGEWPQCLLCGRPVQGYGVEHMGSRHAEVRVRCHGAEESYRIGWEEYGEMRAGRSEEDEDELWHALSRQLASIKAFDPTIPPK